MPVEDVAVGLLGEARSALTQVLDVRGWDASAEVVRERMRAAHEVLAIAEAARLAAIRCLQDHPEAVPEAKGAGPGTAAAIYAIHVLNVSPQQARRDVAVAQAVDPDGDVLPEVGRALAEGRLSRAHVEVAVSAVQQLPAAVKKLVLDDGRTGLQWIDAFLVEHSERLSAATVKTLTRELLARLDPERAADLGKDAVQRRGLTLRTGVDGMIEGRFTLDPANGVQVSAVLAEFATPYPAGTADRAEGAGSGAASGGSTGGGTSGGADGAGEGGGGEQEVLVRDQRTYRQRMADALVTIAAIAARAGDPTREAPADDSDGAPGAAPAGGTGPRTEIVVTVPLAQLIAAFLAAGTPLPDWAAAATTVTGAAQDGASGGRQAVPGPRWDDHDGLARADLAGQGDWPGAAVDAATLARWACEAWFRPLVLDHRGVPLRMGRARRLATPAQRAAVIARDAGCVIPGCTAPATWCEVHHVIPWSRGGLTDVDAMALICPRHHTEVHAGVWELRMRDGVPWAVPPSWIDRERRPMRNTTHLARAAANRLARRIRDEQLRLDLSLPRRGGGEPGSGAPAWRGRSGVGVTGEWPRSGCGGPRGCVVPGRGRVHAQPRSVRSVLPERRGALSGRAPGNSSPDRGPHLRAGP